MTVGNEVTRADMVGDIGGEVMRQGGRMDRVKEQIVLIARPQTPGRGAGEIARPARGGYVCEADAVLGGEVGRITGDASRSAQVGRS